MTPTTFFPFPIEFLVNLPMGYRILGDIPAAGAKATIDAVFRKVITIF